MLSCDLLESPFVLGGATDVDLIVVDLYFEAGR